MLTCLEILNILYMKCIELCSEIKFKYNSTFNDRRHRPYNFNNEIYTARYNRDVVIDIDRQVVLEAVNGPILLNKDIHSNVIHQTNLMPISEEYTLDTFTGELKSPTGSETSNISAESDWSVLMDDSN